MMWQKRILGVKKSLNHSLVLINTSGDKIGFDIRTHSPFPSSSSSPIKAKDCSLAT